MTITSLHLLLHLAWFQGSLAVKDESSLGHLQTVRQTLDRTLQKKWGKTEEKGYSGAPAGNSDPAPTAETHDEPPPAEPAPQAKAEEAPAEPETPAEQQEKNWLAHENPGCKSMVDKRSRWYNIGKKDIEQATVNEGAALCKAFDKLKANGLDVKVKIDKLKAKVQAEKGTSTGLRASYDSKVQQLKSMTAIINKKYARIMEREVKLGGALAEVGSATQKQSQSGNDTSAQSSVSANA